MLASQYGKAAGGVGKFWCAVGDDAELFDEGPFPSEEAAAEAARRLMLEEGEDAAQVGVGEEAAVVVPDADEIIERIAGGMDEQCGEGDYLGHLPAAQKEELTAAVEKAVADWLTKHDLWPTFCKIRVLQTVAAPDRPAAAGRREGRA